MSGLLGTLRSAIIQNLGKTNPYAVALSLPAAVILLSMNYVQKKLPTHLWPRATTLVLMVLGTAVSFALTLEDPPYNVVVVGQLPTGLPGIGLPRLPPSVSFSELLGGVATLIVVGFVESIAVAKATASKAHSRLTRNASPAPAQHTRPVLHAAASPEPMTSARQPLPQSYARWGSRSTRTVSWWG